MVKNFLCNSCVLYGKCKVPKMLKPFTDDAKVDLGVQISMSSCDTYKAAKVVAPSSEEEENN